MQSNHFRASNLQTEIIRSVCEQKELQIGLMRLVVITSTDWDNNSWNFVLKDEEAGNTK